jgi:DNA-binding transcriptional ArsR family regulator
MKAAFVISDPHIARVLIDPMRRAILDLLRERPMTQTQLANELGLSSASLNYHIKLLLSKKLVTIARKQVGAHGIMEIFYSSTVYYFVYDLDSLPNEIRRYFHPLSLERARAVISTLFLKSNSFQIDQTPKGIDEISIELSRMITSVARAYEKKVVQQGKENTTLEIYNKAIRRLLKKLGSH